MDRGFRRGFTTAEKTELWDRWQRGESLKAIGRAFRSGHRFHAG
jgi:IS30 family transposase